MTAFVLCAALALVLVVFQLLRPFLFAATTSSASHAQVNTAIYRDQLRKLEQDLTDGLLSKDDYQQAKDELQGRALDDTAATEAVARPLQIPSKTLIGVCSLLPVAAVALYLVLGRPAAIAPPAPVQQAGQPTRQDIENMVARLAARMQQEPNNLQGWAMLARSYKVLGRLPEAEQAFAKAGSFIDKDPELLTSYADTAATNANGSFAGKPDALIAKALALDPSNPMAQWLQGQSAMSKGDKATAVKVWQKLLASLPPNSDDARLLQGAIVQAQGVPGAMAAAVQQTNAGNAPTAAAGPAVLQGTVSIAPALKDKVAPGSWLMVIVRSAGARMPVAVFKQPVTAFPMAFSIDDSMSMNPAAPLSAAKDLTMEARISKTGMAMPEAGDLSGAAQSVQAGASGVQLQVDQVR